MNQTDWVDAGGFLSAFAFCLGMGAAITIDGMVWAALVGTIPAWVYLLATKFHKGMHK